MSQLSAALSAEANGAGGGVDGCAPDAAEHALTTCAAQLAKRFDADLGGFGGAPKYVVRCCLRSLCPLQNARLLTLP